MRGHNESESSGEQGRRILNSQQFKQTGAIGYCPNRNRSAHGQRRQLAVTLAAAAQCRRCVGYLYGPHRWHTDSSESHGGRSTTHPASDAS